MNDLPPERPTQRRKPTRVAVVYNVDFDDATSSSDPGHAARADVAQVAAEVADALSDDSHEVSLVPVGADLCAMRDRLLEIGPDCVFNLCESLACDARLESAVALVLDLMGVSYTGSSPEALSLALHKDRVKSELAAAGVPTPRSCLMARPEDPCSLAFPLIVKPNREDGSLGISPESVVATEAALRARVSEVTRTLAQPCLVEEFVEGRELNVALVGYPSARVLPLSEIDFGELAAGAPRIVSYEAKWSPGSAADRATRPVLRPDLPGGLAVKVRRAAQEAFRAVGLRDYGRVDVRLSRSGVPFVIDVNPNCDLSPSAGLARSAASVGITYHALVRLLVRYAMRRRRARARDLPLRLAKRA
jgi:D-alanine-D-alanine ligase